MDVKQALDYALKAPVTAALGDYIASLVEKAKKAGSKETDGTNTIEHPDLTATEQAILIGAVTGFMGGH